MMMRRIRNGNAPTASVTHRSVSITVANAYVMSTTHMARPTYRDFTPDVGSCSSRKSFCRWLSLTPLALAAISSAAPSVCDSLTSALEILRPWSAVPEDAVGRTFVCLGSPDSEGSGVFEWWLRSMDLNPANLQICVERVGALSTVLRKNKRTVCGASVFSGLQRTMV